jgi:hypothetical protein
MASFPRALVFTLILSSPSLVFAQTAGTIVGSVTDESKAVLPGVTVTAKEVSTGRSYTSVTDARGDYTINNVLAGTYKVDAVLAGFSTSSVPAVELLVGTNDTVNFTLKLASLSESLTVTGEAPLVDVRSTAVAGNVDRRQMEELPLSGRNWLEMTLLVKGITANELSQNKPAVQSDMDFNLSLDGQQTQQAVAGSSSFAQPGMSREAIAEYQVSTNLFDVTSGHSSGVQVQAISRNGTNKLSGNVYGYFRDSRMNAKDFVAQKVLPYQNQQIGGSLGGPIVKDKTHYFATFERENEPATSVFHPPGYVASISLPHPRHQYRLLARGDHQLKQGQNLSVRLVTFRDVNPFGIQDGSVHPTRQSDQSFDSYSLQGTWTHVVSNSFVQEVRVGMFHYHWNHVPAAGVPQLPASTTAIGLPGQPIYSPDANYAFPGLAIGARSNYPEEFWQDTPSVRTDLSWHHGSHDVKFGGEYLHWHDTGWWINAGRGIFTFSAIPADVESRFPLDAWNDASKWNLAGLDPLVIRYQQNYAQTGGDGIAQRGNCPVPDGCGNFSLNIPRPYWSAWFGDTWKVNSKLTVNYGLRYDLDWGVTAPPYITATTASADTGAPQSVNEDLGFGGAGVFDVGYHNDIRDKMGFQPRGGVTYDPSGDAKFIIRGGTGIYYGQSTSELPFDSQLFDGQRVFVNQYPNDGLPNFILDPTRGVTATQILNHTVPLPAQAAFVIEPHYKLPGTWQNTFGFQTSIGDVWGLDSDLTYYRGFHRPNNTDVNNFYDPGSGYPKNPAIYGRPYPAFGQMNYRFSTGKSNNLSLASQLTRRFRDGFQVNIAYTRVFYRNDENPGTGGYAGTMNNAFSLSQEWGRASDAQRDTLRATTIVRLPHQFSLAATYIMGSGQWYQSVYAQNPVGFQGTRLIPKPGAVFGLINGYDGSLVPRNDFEGKPIHKVDMRLTKDFTLGRMKVTGIAEVFNVFNHANYGAYNLTINAANYGTPVQPFLSTTYIPRSGQLAFKLSF